MLFLQALMRRLRCVFLAVAAVASPAQAMPALHHVFLIVLENHSFPATFGRYSKAPYLAHTLAAQGTLLANYFGIGHASLDNYIAIISGQPPNEDTQGDCGTYTEFKLRRSGLDSEGRALGRGCVYPRFVKTLPDQLEEKGFTWRAYLEDMGRDPRREEAACAHPAPNAPDGTQGATPTDQYATKHNPFVYFHSIIDDRARCASHVVSLDRLPEDLAGRTPNFVYIAPNLCDDGHDIPCIDRRPGGLIAIDAFLQHWVPQIMESAAFRQDGMLVITFDESASRNAADSESCCGEEGMPGASVAPGINGPGGGRIGALILSPQAKPAKVAAAAYNHYSLLRTIEDAFGLSHLAGAGGAGVTSFGSDVFR